MSDDHRSNRTGDIFVGNEKELQSERKQGRAVRFGPVLASAGFLLLAVFLSVVAVGLLASYGFGNILATPREAADLRQESLSLQQTMTALQARQAQLEQRSGSNAEEIAALEQDMQNLDQRMQNFEQQAQDLVLLSNDLQENISEVATIQAESEEGRMAIVVMATVQAEREERLVQIEDGLNDLRDRTNRLFRFIERLNDLAGQTENGLALPGETPAPEGTPVTLAPARSPTPTPTPSAETTTEVRGENGQASEASMNNAKEVTL